MKDLTRSILALAPGLLLSFCVGSAPVMAAEDGDAATWPAFRGHDLNGLSTEPIPTEWGPEAILWKTEIEGRGHSSPIVWGNRIFLTTAIEGDEIEGAGPPTHTFSGQEFKHPMAVAGNRHHTMKVMALDTASGEILWSQIAYEGPVYDDRHQDSSYASPTPVTDGKRVYAYFGSEGVYAYDFDGEPVWKTDIGDIKTVGLGVASSPVLFEELIIFQADEDSGEDSFIAALDTATGKEAWRTPRPVQVSWATPRIVEHDGRVEMLTSGNEWVISYDPSTGKELWRAPGLENNAIHVPLVIDDLVIFTSGYPEKMSFAMRLGGEGELGKDARVWQYEKGTAYMPSNLLVDGLLYLTNDGGVITCLDARTGGVVYEGGRAVGGRFAASLVGIDGKVLQINQDGDAAFIKAGREHEVIATGELGEQVWATPAIAGGRIYVRGNQHLFAIGKK